MLSAVGMKEATSYICSLLPLSETFRIHSASDNYGIKRCQLCAHFPMCPLGSTSVDLNLLRNMVIDMNEDIRH